MSDRAGAFRHRVDVLTKTIAKDAIGAGKETWTTAFRLWAKVEHDFRPVDQYAGVSSTQARSDATWFIVRYPGANRMPTEEMRLHHEGTTYQITTVRAAQQESSRVVEMLCKRVAP